jgi:hypothetical protein
MSKKGALEIGINTVVYLIIAFVIIAGGIYFVNKLFDNIDPVGLIPKPKFPASSSEPIVLEGGDPKLKMGSEKNLDVNAYNMLNSDVTVDVVIDACTSKVINSGCDNPIPVLSTMAQTIKSGESGGFRTIISANCASNTALKLASGQYVCNLKSIAKTEPLQTLSELQIIITVTN